MIVYWNLITQLDKSELIKRKVAYIGDILIPDVQQNFDIQNYSIPKRTKRINESLRLSGYYRKFIKYFINITEPYKKCLIKNNEININDPEYPQWFKIWKFPDK